MWIKLRLMFSILVSLLAAWGAQARYVHVEESGYAQSHALYEDRHEEFLSGGRITSFNLQFPPLLQRCLADVSCSDALAAAATAAAAARQQQQQEHPQQHVGNTDELALFPTGAAAQKQLPQQQQQQQQPKKPSDAAAAGDHDRARIGAGGRGAWRIDSDGDAVATDVGLGDGRDMADDVDDPTSLSLKGLAALILFVEAVAGMYLPLALQRLQSPQWWLSLLNCFSGGIFLAAGIIHLLPHCAEAQEALGPIGPNGDYPLYLVLVVVGYCVVFYVERVLFDVHGEGHAHCQHSNVFSHSSYYKAISHRSRRISRLPSATAAAAAGAVVCTSAGPDPLGLPTSSAHACGAEEAAEAGLGVLPPLHHHNQQQQQYRPPQPQLEGCGGGASGGSAGDASQHPRKPDGAVEADGPLIPHHSHGHGGCQHSHQRGSHNHNHGHALGGLPMSAEGLCLTATGVAYALPAAAGEAAVAGDDDDEDDESCHSDHPPRAVCVCVEEEEAEAEAEARALRAAVSSSQSHPQHHNHNDHQGHGHEHAHAHAHGRGPAAGGSRPHGSGSGGGGSGDHLRLPLLLAEQLSAPPTPFGDASASSNAADAIGAGANGLQHPELPHPPDSCAYHPHHHHHHRYRRRSAGTAGPLPPGAAAVAAAAAALHSTGGSDSPASSCASSLAGHFVDLPPHHHQPHHHHTLHHNHHHAHAHAHHHHHVIKPRFRFMHGVVLLVALALHTSLECIALGLINSRPQFLLLFAAIASHKAVSALALSSRFLREGATLAQVTGYVGPFCLVAPASILAGVYVGCVAPAARLVFSCFATGTFLYVGASEVIMEEFEGEMRADRRDISTRAARYAKFGAVLAAVALVAASGLLPEPDHH